MIETVAKYNKYLETLPELISKSFYKAEYFINALEISQATYYRRLRENSFSPEEVTILTNLLFPKEAYEKEFLEAIEAGRKDFKKGNIFTSEEAAKLRAEKIKSYQ